MHQCVCISLCRCGCVKHQYLAYNIYFLKSLGPMNTEPRRLVCMKPYVDALQTFAWQKQPGQDVGTPKNRSEGEVCLHMWLSLWPLTQRWAICNPNKRRHPGDFLALHNAPLDWNRQLLTLLSKHLATLEVTCFPLRTVYLHRSIFP